LVLIGRGWETRWRFYEGGIVGGGESRSVGSPSRTRSGAGRAGWEAGARWVGSVHWRTKMHPGAFWCRRRIYIYIYIYISEGRIFYIYITQQQPNYWPKRPTVAFFLLRVSSRRQSTPLSSRTCRRRELARQVTAGGVCGRGSDLSVRVSRCRRQPYGSPK
jgi:hypothetical protein